MSFDVRLFTRHEFERLREPAHWFAKAVSLRTAARVLFVHAAQTIDEYKSAWVDAERLMALETRDQIEIAAEEPDLGPAYLLYGYALENVLKATCIIRDPSLVQTTGRIPWPDNGHNLQALATLCKISLSKSDEELFAWLAQVINWKGRYSSPNRAQDLSKFWAFDYAHGVYGNHVIHTIELFIEQVELSLPDDVRKPDRQRSLLVAVPARTKEC